MKINAKTVAYANMMNIVPANVAGFVFLRTEPPKSFVAAFLYVAGDSNKIDRHWYT